MQTPDHIFDDRAGYRNKAHAAGQTARIVAADTADLYCGSLGIEGADRLEMIAEAIRLYCEEGVSHAELHEAMAEKAEDFIE